MRTLVQASLLTVVLGLAGCATGPQRPAASSVSCARAVVAELPPGLNDFEKHCVASAGIARQCSPFEAWLAGWGKEVQDAFAGGDASWQDLDADRIGRHCASAPAGAEALLECCRQTLAAPRG
jgi:hypothetical protein